METNSDLELLKRSFAGQGVLRSLELERLGFSRNQILKATQAQVLERMGRGLYALRGAEVAEHQSLLHVSKAVPHARICLLSALRFHELTTQNPHEVWIAIRRQDWKPVLRYPKLRVHRFSGAAFDEGLEAHTIQGTQIRVYSVAKTVVDLFRYRRKIGIDVALEALREGWREKRFAMAELDRVARLCRMSRIMAPYLESLIR